MKARYLRVTSRGIHSDAVSGNEEVSTVDTLAVKLQTEMEELQEREKVRHHFADAINSFNDGNDKFLSAITSFVENKAAVEREAAKNHERDVFMKLLDKLDRGIISREEFNEMKTRFF